LSPPRPRVVCLYRRDATSGESFELSKRGDTHTHVSYRLSVCERPSRHTHTHGLEPCAFFFLDRGGERGVEFVSSRVGFFFHRLYIDVLYNIRVYYLGFEPWSERCFRRTSDRDDIVAHTLTTTLSELIFISSWNLDRWLLLRFQCFVRGARRLSWTCIFTSNFLYRILSF
jgi:hypothetical protein